MWVKLCANTSLADAQAAAAAGADAVGFVLAPSSRRVTATQVRTITDNLPATIERIGVFPADTAEAIAASANAAGLTGVQLHFGFNPALAETLGKLLPGMLILPVVPWLIGADEASAESARRTLATIRADGRYPRVLVDAKLAGTSGGTGQNFNWSAAAPIFEEFAAMNLILAGGLRPENLAEAIALLQPWGVDVASGVEASPGRKDRRRVEEFVAVARGARSKS